MVGIDEVGRGAWAGPLTVGAAIIPSDRRVYKIRDSKMLTEPERESMFSRLASWSSWSVGHVTAAECDELGMSEALRLGAHRALAQLPPADVVLLDGNHDFANAPVAETIVKGDQKSVSIAAASILAKVTRDRIMRDEATRYPVYRFESNKGYPCPVHRAALQEWGPCVLHRVSWSFMDSLATGPGEGVNGRRPL